MLQAILARLTINAVIIGLLVLALVVQTTRIEGFKFWPLSIEGYKSKVERLSDKLRDISSADNKQKKTTSGSMDRADKLDKDGAARAKRVENAPLPGNGATPREILGADL